MKYFIEILLHSRVAPEAVVQLCSVKKVFLEIAQNSQENAWARESLIIIVIFQLKMTSWTFLIGQVWSLFCEGTPNSLFHVVVIQAMSCFFKLVVNKNVNHWLATLHCLSMMHYRSICAKLFYEKSCSKNSHNS